MAPGAAAVADGDTPPPVPHTDNDDAANADDKVSARQLRSRAQEAGKKLSKDTIHKQAHHPPPSLLPSRRMWGGDASANLPVGAQIWSLGCSLVRTVMQGCANVCDLTLTFPVGLPSRKASAFFLAPL